jgi:SPP1 gp7 family putative phage head morphogenesis protein
MPVRKVRGGYKWGRRGHVYKSRAGAEAQARAAYANGYRENSKEMNKIVRLLKASPRAETRYTVELDAIMSAIHRGVLNVVKKEFPLDGSLRQDADEPPELPAVKVHIGLGARLLGLIAAWALPRIQEAYDRMAEDVIIRVTDGLALIGIDPRHAAGIDSFIEQARHENVELIKNASADFLAQVRATLDEFEGRPAKDLAAALQQRVEVSRSRAQLIARDQVLKLNSQIIEMRCRSAGVDSYHWSTSQDERVRPMHAELEGSVHTWDDPPVTNPDGDTNHPGEDYQCRCLPIPIISDEPSGETD